MIPGNSRLNRLIENYFDVLSNEADKILLAEDKLDARRGLKELLENHGFKAITARSGRHAITVVSKAHKQFFIILMDCKMPGEIDGIEAARIIKERYPKIKVVFVTGHAEETRIKNQLKSINVSKKDTIDKPIGLNKNEKKLIRLLKREYEQKKVDRILDSYLTKIRPQGQLQIFLQEFIKNVGFRKILAAYKNISHNDNIKRENLDITELVLNNHYYRKNIEKLNKMRFSIKLKFIKRCDRICHTTML